MTEELTLVLPNRLEHIGQIGDGVREFFRAQELDSGAAMHLTLALDELATNAIQYGFEPGAELTAAVRITLHRQDDAVVAVMEDRGRPFDPFSVPEPDMSADIDGRAIGGLGVHFVRQFVDEAEYEYVDGRNRVRLCKRL